MRSEPETPSAPQAVQRLRLACVGLALTLLTFSQSSGLEAADTKLDLVVSPARFLRNSLVMWDPTAAAGQLQDQAYGYLFPMGPFFLLGKLTALPPWIVQRGWESALLVVAFLGVVRLCRLLGVPGFWPRVAGGLAYALAPRMLMELGVISSELLPVVVLPWVLIPLVRGAAEGSPRRAAARSGIALLFASGINAAATLAILPVPALWLVTRTAGRRRRALMTWWLVAVALACLWWAVPLLVLGKYSPPFLDWIESSAVTTSRTNLVDALRGVDHWQAYLGPNVWPAGWILAVAPAAILATTGIAAIGVLGLARRATPHRSFLAAVLVLGLVLVTLGHAAPVGPPFAGSARHLLDGVLVPFRNVHKFDPIVRLPLSIGLGHALAALARRVPARAVVQVKRAPVGYYPQALVTVAVIGLAATAISPALAGRIVPQTRSPSDPTWWAQVGSWLGAHRGDGRALVVPGAGQPVYLWGAPRDDALQPLADGPWTVRDAAPLAQPGYIRLLDSIESTIASGRADATLAPVLARSGIRYLVVRNDLDTGRSGATPLRFVHATISNSPGLVPAASFGPRLTAPYDARRLVDLGLTRSEGAVDVYANTAWRAQVALLPADGTLVANGSSDQLPQLVATGLSATTPVIFGTEPAAVRAAGAATAAVFTDGTRRREFGFGGVDQYSATMTAAQPYVAQRAVHDYLPDGSADLSTIDYTGISDVQVSSAAGSAQAGWAALDGDPKTAWVSNSVSGAVGQWIHIELPRALSASSIELAFAPGRASYPTRLKVTTDSGVVDDDVSPDSNTQALQLPAGATRSIRLTVAEMSVARRGSSVSLAGLALPGVLPSRTLAVAGVADPDLVSFSVLSGARAVCLTVQGAAACDPSFGATGEEDTALDRTFRVARAATLSASVGLRPQPGAQLNNLLDAGNPLRAIASSVDSADPRERAGAAVDGDSRTGWVAKAGDHLPSMQVTIPKAHRLSGIQLLPIRDAPTTAPTQVVITVGGSSFAAAVPTDGRITFPRPLVAGTLRVAVTAATLRITTDSAFGRRALLPVGIGEIRLLGDGAPVGRGADALRLACGDGPSLLLNGAVIDLRVNAPTAQVLDGASVTAQPCGPGTVQLLNGVNRIRVGADAVFRPDSITLRAAVRAGAATAASTRSASIRSAGTLQVRSWADTRRDIQVATTRLAFLSVAENANAGWSATLHGATLPAVTMDGWHQGWLVPAGTRGVVHLAFTPQREVDSGLVLGAVAVLALVAAALVRPRRPNEVLAPVVDTVPRARWVLGCAIIGLAALGGLAGLAVLAAVLILRRLVGRPWRADRVDRPTRPGPSEAAFAGVSREQILVVLTLPLVLAGAAESIGPAGSARDFASDGAVQVLCLLTLALLVVTLLPAPAPRAAESSQQRPFQKVVRRGGGGGSGERGEGEQGDEMPAEDRPAKLMLDEDQQR